VIENEVNSDRASTSRAHIVAQRRSVETMAGCWHLRLSSVTLSGYAPFSKCAWLNLGDVARLAYELTMIALTVGIVTRIAVGEPYPAAGTRAQRLLRKFAYIAVPLLIAGTVRPVIPLL